MIKKKEDEFLKNQGFHYEFDGIKFKSKEDLESYKKLPKKSEKEISEEKIAEDAKAEADRVAEEKRITEEKIIAQEAEESRIEFDRVAKEKAKSSRENIGDIKSDEINKSKATKFWWLA